MKNIRSADSTLLAVAMQNLNISDASHQKHDVISPTANQRNLRQLYAQKSIGGSKRAGVLEMRPLSVQIISFICKLQITKYIQNFVAMLLLRYE